MSRQITGFSPHQSPVFLEEETQVLSLASN